MLLDDQGGQRAVADSLARYRLAGLTLDQLDALQRDLDLAWQIQGGLLPNPNLKEIIGILFQFR